MVCVSVHFLLQMFITFLSIPFKKFSWFSRLLYCKNLSEFPFRLGKWVKETKETWTTSFQKLLIVAARERRRKYTFGDRKSNFPGALVLLQLFSILYILYFKWFLVYPLLSFFTCVCFDGKWNGEERNEVVLPIANCPLPRIKIPFSFVSSSFLFFSFLF